MVVGRVLRAAAGLQFIYELQCSPSKAESLRGVSCLGGGGVTMGVLSLEEDLLFLSGTA